MGRARPRAAGKTLVACVFRQVWPAPLGTRSHRLRVARSCVRNKSIMARNRGMQMDARNESQPAAAYRVVIVDDHPLFRAALKSAVSDACATGELFEAD